MHLLDHLRARHTGVTLADLAHEFEVTPRQIRRDLEALEHAGHALDTFTPDGGPARVRLVDPKFKGIHLTMSERYALLAARGVFGALEGTPFYDDVSSVYGKIIASLPVEHRKDHEKLGDRFVYLPDGGTKSYRKKADLLYELLGGVLHQRPVAYVYVKPDGAKREGTLHVYGMAMYRQGVYVVGRPIEAEEKPGPAVRVYAAERFVRARCVKGEKFDVPKDFSIKQFFHGAFGVFVGDTPTEVHIEFSEAVREAVESRTWHPSQKLERLKNGKVRLKFQVGHTAQVVSWLLSWGEHARLLEPPKLAEEVRGVIARMAR